MAMTYEDIFGGNYLYLRQVYLTIASTAGGVKRFTNLRVSFEIEKTNESNPNAARIDVYNLSEATRSLLEAANTRVVLEAGYKDTVAAIFMGNVTKVVHEKSGPDLVTKIEAADGDNRFRNSRVERGFPAGVKTRDIFQKLSSDLGLPMSSSLDVIPNTQYANGLTLSGLVRDQLDELCQKNDLEWSIQDETLQITPAGRATLDAVVLISPQTGLVGSPNKTKKGVEFISLLQPKLRPGRRVKIESKAVNGIFKLRKVVHVGDSHQGDFHSNCEATG